MRSYPVGDRGGVLAAHSFVMLNIRHILCPVDLSDASLAALEHAFALAGWYEASLQVLYVDTTTPLEGLSDFKEFAVASATAVEGPRTSPVAEEVQRFVARAGGERAADVVVEHSTRIERSILERAEALSADVIVMGSHGRLGVQRLVLGSVAERVLRGSPCPVMVVPPHDLVPRSVVSFKRILCAVDFSESSLSAVTWALSLAEEADAHLWLLHIIEVPPELRASGVVTDREIDELHAAFDAAALSRLRALIPVNAADACSVETATASGAAGHAILAFAEGHQADLIVMGAQGHGALDRLLFGSKTRDVIHGAGCPVLAVRP